MPTSIQLTSDTAKRGRIPPGKTDIRKSGLNGRGKVGWGGMGLDIYGWLDFDVMFVKYCVTRLSYRLALHVRLSRLTWHQKDVGFLPTTGTFRATNRPSLITMIWLLLKA